MDRVEVTVGFYGPSIEVLAGGCWGVAAGLGGWFLAYMAGLTADWAASVIPILIFIPVAIGVTGWLEGKRR